MKEKNVSFEVAKLLKEKGFDESTNCQYPVCGIHIGEVGEYNITDRSRNPEKYIPAPTLQMVMKWLREKHSQNVTVKAHNNVARLKTIYYAEVQNLSEPAEKGFCVNGCIFKDTYEDACEAAIKYCLEKLI